MCTSVWGFPMESVLFLFFLFVCFVVRCAAATRVSLHYQRCAYANKLASIALLSIRGDLLATRYSILMIILLIFFFLCCVKLCHRDRCLPGSNKSVRSWDRNIYFLFCFVCPPIGCSACPGGSVIEWRGRGRGLGRG